VKRFSDISKDKILDGEKRRIDDILNQEVCFLSYTIRDSKYTDNKSGLCMTIQFEQDGKHYVIFTGSAILMDQFERYGDELPFLATIRKISKYYT
jgi:hypothetical protein